MKYLATLFLILGFGLSGFGQTIKSLGYNTTNGQVVYSGTNTLTFPTIINAEELAHSGDVAIQLANRELISEGQSVLGWGSNYVEFSQPITFAGTNAAPASRTNLGLGWPALTNTNAATSLLGFTTNGQVIAIEPTLIFTNNIDVYGVVRAQELTVMGTNGIVFDENESSTSTRANLGFSTNLNTLWTATNASNARSAVGLGWSALTNTNADSFRNAIDLGISNVVYFSEVGVGPNSYTISGTSVNVISNRGFAFNQAGIPFLTISNLMGTDGGALVFHGALGVATTRTNLGLGATWLTNTNVSSFREAIGLGATNTVTFGGIVNNGNFTNNNGTIYGLKTNVGPFEGIGNFFASNNTTLSNETLFRVGLAESTNKSAQFGFRVTRTNNGGEGVAVYSVFGYNALMMIGPSDRSRTNYATNTNAGIEATLWTITPTNQVMTLRDTNTGATTLHQSLGFDTNVTSTAPANTTNIVKWIEVWVGTNSYRMPLYQ